jgi:hypothetical protein
MGKKKKNAYIESMQKSAVVHTIKINEGEGLRCIENCASESTGRARDEVVEKLSL